MAAMAAAATGPARPAGLRPRPLPDTPRGGARGGALFIPCLPLNRSTENEKFPGIARAPGCVSCAGLALSSGGSRGAFPGLWCQNENPKPSAESQTRSAAKPGSVFCHALFCDVKEQNSECCKREEGAEFRLHVTALRL